MKSWNLDALCISTIRTLSIDAMQHAQAGHPGTPMALAPVAYCLWQCFLRFDPNDPLWPNRDRFVLSNGPPRCCSMSCCLGLQRRRGHPFSRLWLERHTGGGRQ